MSEYHSDPGAPSGEGSSLPGARSGGVESGGGKAGVVAMSYQGSILAQSMGSSLRGSGTALPNTSGGSGGGEDAAARGAGPSALSADVGQRPGSALSLAATVFSGEGVRLGVMGQRGCWGRGGLREKCVGGKGPTWP